jgi:trehalose 2-sulfotransferase
VSGIWEPRSPRWDADPPRDLGLPARCYVVCSTPRNGSGMLCRGLAASGVAGAPAEYYNINQRVPLAERWGSGPGLRAYTDALRGRRSSAAGVFGTKLHWDQLEGLFGELLPEGLPDDLAERYAAAGAALRALLPDVRFVHLVRVDVDRQAVSLWTALNRNVWSVRAESGAAAVTTAAGAGEATPSGGEPSGAASPVPYDFAAIDRCRAFLAHGDLAWDRFFRANGIAPVQVTYEGLIGDFEPTCARVLRELLGDEVARGSGPLPAGPDSVRQADEHSEALLARYRAERPPVTVPAP